MFGSQKLSSSVDNRERNEWQEAQNSFLREWEIRIDNANTKIENSVEEFAKNFAKELWPDLTHKLTEYHEEYKKDPSYSWLSDSDIWLQALEELYRNNQDKMPWQLEWYLTKMIELLSKYKQERNTTDDIALTLRSATSVSELSETSSNLSWEELPPFNSRIRPAEGIVPFNA